MGVSFLHLALSRLFVLRLVVYLLPLTLLALTVVLCQVAVLAQAFGIVELVRMLTRPSLLRSTDLVIARHTHLLRVVTPGVMRAAQHLILATILVFLLWLLLLGSRRDVGVDVWVLRNRCGLIVLMKLH